MKHLLHWHLHFLLTRKTRWFLFLLIAINSVVYVMMTRWYEPEYERIIYADMFARDYAFEVLTFMKTSLVALMAYLGIQLFHFSHYDIVLVQRVGRTKLFLSQCLALVVLLGGTLVILILQATAVSRWFNVAHLWSPANTLAALTVMLIHHIMLSSCLSLVIHHLSSHFIVWFGFLLSEVLVPYGATPTATPSLAYVIQLFIANAHLQETGQMTLLYRPHIVLLGATVYGFIGMIRVLSRDF